jgi:hypothetical protein
VAAALPDARIVVLEGQEHVADILVPKTFPSMLWRSWARAEAQPKATEDVVNPGML